MDTTLTPTLTPTLSPVPPSYPTFTPTLPPPYPHPTPTLPPPYPHPPYPRGGGYGGGGFYPGALSSNSPAPPPYPPPPPQPPYLFALAAGEGYCTTAGGGEGSFDVRLDVDETGFESLNVLLVCQKCKLQRQKREPPMVFETMTSTLLYPTNCSMLSPPPSLPMCVVIRLLLQVPRRVCTHCALRRL